MNKKKKNKLNIRRDIPYSWADILNLVKMSALPKLIYRVNPIPIKIPVSYFVDITKMILKLIWRSKRPRIVNTILKKNKLEDQHHLILTQCKTYNNQDSTVLVKEQRYSPMEHKRKPRNRITQIQSTGFSQTIKAIQWREEFLQQMVL